MSAARTERLLNLLTLLLNARRPVSLREIRAMPEFSAYHTRDPKSGERAFERDKAALVELGVPLRWVAPENEDEDGSGGYVVDRESYYLPEIDLTPSDLALLSISGAAVAAIPRFPARAAVIRALNKLGFDVDEHEGRPILAHAPVLHRDAQERVGEYLNVLQDALANRRRVQLSYRSIRKSIGEERLVDPYGLYYRQGIWYLVGHCHLRKGERTFHLGRIERLSIPKSGRKQDDYEIPEAFDLSEHVRRRPWEFPEHPPEQVCVRLAERLVPAIPELFGERARHEVRDGEHFVTLTVSARSAFIAAVLPHGAAAEVVEPAELRATIAAVYTTLAERYGSIERSDREHL